MNYEKEFLEGKLAVNCRTENQLNKLRTWCVSIGMGVPPFEWSTFCENTCCKYENTKNKLSECDKACYIPNNYKVVTYKQFMTDIKAEQEEDKEIAKIIHERDKKDNGTRIPLEDLKKIIKQEYTFAEVVSRIKEGEEYICINPTYNIKSIDMDNKCIHFNFKNLEYDAECCIANDTRFILKQPEPEYMNFEDAAVLKKRLKHKDWTEFKTLKEATMYISDYPQGQIYEMLNEKAWEVEE
jgi:hypothetical protein